MRCLWKRFKSCIIGVNNRNAMQIKNITIPKPCHQNWQQMTPAEYGRHCDHCCKTVVDFTAMTNAQVIDYLSSSAKVCGRFSQNQVESINKQLVVNELSARNRWKWTAIAFSLLSTISAIKASAQSKPVPVEQGQADKKDKPDNVILGKVIPNHFKTVSGCISDENNMPLPGATVKAYNSSVGTLTDANGNFKLQVPVNTLQITVSSIGYRTQQVDLTSADPYQVKLHLEPMLLGEPAVVFQKQSLVKRIYYRAIKRPLRKIFN